jgi:phosphoglycolate phosphatase
MTYRYSFHLIDPLPPERADEIDPIVERGNELVMAMVWPSGVPELRSVSSRSGARRIIGNLNVGSSIIFEAAGLNVEPLLIEVLKTLSTEFETGWRLEEKQKTARSDTVRIREKEKGLSQQGCLCASVHTARTGRGVLEVLMSETFGGPLNLIIFDLDGTLVDSGEAVSDAFNWALREKGYAEAPVDSICSTIGHPLPVMFAPYVPENQDPDEMVELYRVRYSEIFIEKTYLIDGAADTILKLADAGYDLGVATTKPRSFTEPILENLGVLKHFKTVAGAEEVENLKPAPDVILLAMKRLGRGPEETLFVGDTPLDVRAARAANTRVVCVLTGHAPEDELRACGPDMIFKNLPELEKWINSCA